MYNKEYEKEGICTRCGETLKGRQQSWCSLNCSRLGLKREYKKRNPEKIREYRQKVRLKQRPIGYKRAQKLRKGKKCVRCKSKEKLNVHHIVPRRAGGTNDISNLMILCFPCHMKWEIRMKDYWLK